MSAESTVSIASGVSTALVSGLSPVFPHLTVSTASRVSLESTVSTAPGVSTASAVFTVLAVSTVSGVFTDALDAVDTPHAVDTLVTVHEGTFDALDACRHI